MKAQPQQEFVADYIQTCINNGTQRTADIREQAESEIKGIDAKMKENESLRSKKNYLQAVVRHLGGGTKTKATEKRMDFSMSWGQLESSFQELCILICEFVTTKGDEGTNPREIMETLNLVREQKVVFSAVKWLWHNNIISRQESNKTLVKGSGWDKFMASINDESN